MEDHKFVLCIPRGGINDMLTQIKYCFDFCKTSGRKCILDTQRTIEFEHSVFDFFDISDGCLSSFTPSEFYRYVAETPSLTIYPPTITREILPTFMVNTWDTRFGCSTFGDMPLKPFETQDYHESIIVHYTFGTGNTAAWFLKSFPPKPILLNELRTRYAALGENYLGIHIRNTDYKSDVSGFISTYDSQIRSAPVVFLATDDPVTISNMKSLYGDKIHTFSSLIDLTPGCTQHYRFNKPPAFVIDTFCDLILLGLSSSYIHSTSPSGYTRNARCLTEDTEFRAFYKRLLSP